MRRSISFGILVAALILGGLATPAAQSNAQIQQALQIFLQQAHTWTQTQTFNSIVVTGSCTGCGGGGTPGGADTSVQFKDGGAFGGFGTWDGALLTIPGDAYFERDGNGVKAELGIWNTSQTADAAAEVWAYTTGNAATGNAGLSLTVHGGGSNEARFDLTLAGDSGNATPTTTFTAPGKLEFQVPSFALAGISFDESGTDGMLDTRFRFRTGGVNGDYGYAGFSFDGINSGGGSGVNIMSLGIEAEVSSTDVVTNQRFYIYDPINAAYLLSMTPTGTLFNTPLTIASAQLPATTTTFTNGAAAAVGTLTNAPAAGNPTKWIPIDDNGTTRYIPAW